MIENTDLIVINSFYYMLQIDTKIFKMVRFRFFIVIKWSLGMTFPSRLGGNEDFILFLWILNYGIFISFYFINFCEYVSKWLKLSFYNLQNIEIHVAFLSWLHSVFTYT